MKPIKRPDHNFTYLGPRADIGDLSCQTFTEDGQPIVRSHWRPSQAELELLNQGGSVELDVLAKPLPPVAINVVPAMEGEVDYQ